VFSKISQETPLSDETDFEEAVEATTVAVNEAIRRGGYGVYARVFGRGLRLPERALGEEGGMTMETASALGYDAEISRGIYLRQLARKAFIEVDAKEMWKRALFRRNREEKKYEPGDRVYFWGPGVDNDPLRRWRGPAVVVMSKDPGSIWCSYRGGVIKVSSPNLRSETPEERAALDLPRNSAADQSSTTTSQDLRGKIPFLDLTKEPPPPVGNLEEQEAVANKILAPSSVQAPPPTPAAWPEEQGTVRRDGLTKKTREI